MYPSEIRAQLDRLDFEVREAHASGLHACEAYMKDLEEEISHCRAALVGASVTEIALARAERQGALLG
jgi:hypothetical protein